MNAPRTCRWLGVTGRSPARHLSSLASGVAVLCVLSVLPHPVGARPVPIGRYVEIPFGVSARHPWATGGGGAERRARSRAAAPARPPERRWSEPVGGRPYPPAVAADGVLYVSSTAGVVSLAPSGRRRWERRVGLVSGTPSISPDGHVAVGAQGGDLLMLASRDGEMLMRAPVGGAVRGSPLVLADGSLVASAADSALHRFDADGRRIFRTVLPDRAQSMPAWGGRRTLIVASGPQVLYVAPRGHVVARAVLAEDVVAGPVVADDGTVWVLTDEGGLHALTPDGRVRTRAEVGGAVSLATEMALGPDGAIRFGTRSALVCIGPSGTERWRITSEGAFSGGVTVDRDGTTLAINQRGELFAVEADGHIRWRVATGTRTAAAPVLAADGTIYVSTFGGRVQAWK